MKLPRGVSADRLIRALERLGYTVIRQKGNHIRLFHEAVPTHSISVPLHDPLKIGTFHGILAKCPKRNLYPSRKFSICFDFPDQVQP
jgi:predicted RNA binding protein YcfA (HicA-like mRNA interferase family)